MRKIPELLAPASGWLQLKAAIHNGADAVYIGGALFNARMKADNFSMGEIEDAIEYAHERNVKVYVTLNTLIRDGELAKAFAYANDLYRFGADGLIIQDMGIARLIHKYLPGMHMHLSTQGTVYNEWAVQFVGEMGFDRIVPAREVSLEEMKRLAAACHKRDMTMEVFVHGALCMCYSGQCQMSRLQGGRSGNRGLCAQPCRLEYVDDKGRKSHALSPKDLCLIDDIPALCEAGVDSLKIEGRLKSPEYVAVVTRTYRKYLDLYGAGDLRYTVDPDDRKALRQIFNRGDFTTGYLYENPGEELLSGTSPKNQGLYAGRVVDIRQVHGKGKDKRKLIDIDMRGSESGRLSLGDGVELPNTGNIVTYLEKLSGGRVRIGDFKGDINIGDVVRKVTDREQIKEAMDSIDKEGLVRKIPVKMTFVAAEGEKPRLELDGAVTVMGDQVLEHAQNKPADPDRIRQQLQKLGGTPFVSSDTDVTLYGEPMVPISVVNQLRREAVDKLLATRREICREPLSEDAVAAIVQKEALRASSIDEFRDNAQRGAGWLHDKRLVPLEWFMDKDFDRNNAIPYVLNISKGNLDKYIEKHFDEIVEAVADCGIVLGNMGWIRAFQERNIKVYGDYGLNVFNEQTAKAFAEQDVEIITLSDECSEDGKHVMVGKDLAREPKWMERVPLMVTEHPLDTEVLVDRKNVTHDIFKWYSADKYLIF